MIVDDNGLGAAHGHGTGFHCAREDVDLSNTEGEAAAVYTARGMVAGRPTTEAPFLGSFVCEERNGQVYCGALAVAVHTLCLSGAQLHINAA